MMDHIREMPREELLKLVEVYAKNWLAHDGCWFLAAEESHGMETAMDLDMRAWKHFARAEARRIAEVFEIPEHGGVAALATALRYRLYAAINKQEVEQVDDHTLRFRMLECRVQQTRRKKGLPDFPCKTVGVVEFTQFARAIDPRIETHCIACPPDEVGEFYCGWEFTVAE